MSSEPLALVRGREPAPFQLVERDDLVMKDEIDYESKDRGGGGGALTLLMDGLSSSSSSSPYRSLLLSPRWRRSPGP